MKKIRLALGIMILIISLTILLWSFWPIQRETRVLPISPSEMTLPTPQSHLFGPLSAA
jgi:hypothetical protein